MMSLILMNSVFKWNRIGCRKLMTLRMDQGIFTAFQKSASKNNLVLKASLFTTSPKTVQEREISVREHKIPVPYGHIAAKTWGSETGIPVLAVHGWMDNAGTFDKLIPLLLPSLCVVAIDLPGHGLSSHKPRGSFYSPMDMMIDFKRVIDHLKWTRFSIIGHSMGAALALLYASVFPETVDKFVSLDRSRLLFLIERVTNMKRTEPSQKLEPKIARKVIEDNLKIEKQVPNESPVYSIEAAMKRLQEGMFNQITEDSARIILKRGTQLSNCGTGFIFTRDSRVKLIEVFQRPTDEELRKYASTLECEMLFIKSIDWHPMFLAEPPEVVDEFVKIYEKHCKRFILREVEGNHYVHLNNPERIAPLINSFLE